MPLTDLASIAATARDEHKGLGAFNVVMLEHAEFFVDAAERAQRPIVLQISENAVKYHGGRLAPIGRATLAVAEAATVPVVVHLDHAESTDLIEQAVELGFTSVMYDGSKLPFDQNVATTVRMVQLAHAKGVSVEAELGEVGGKDGVHAPGVRTDPQDAARFAADTGVDLLAVAVGSSHAMTERSAVLDDELIGQIASAVPVPLVLHGSSGVSDEGMLSAIKAGITKVNVSTHLNVLATDVVRRILGDDPKVVDPRKYVGPSVKASADEVQRLLTWYASAAN